jgi:hypothetical protein
MLDPDAKRKGFWLHGKSGSLEHSEAVSGGMSQGKDRMTAGKKSSGGLYTGETASFQKNRIHSGVKEYFTAEGKNLTAEIAHYVPQDVCTDMRTGINADILACTESGELFQYISDSGIMGSRVQFSVRESSCTAFTKLNIAFRVQRSA